MDALLPSYNTACGGSYHSPSGMVQSPGYPGRYPSSRSCEWTITAPVHKQIALIFETFDVGFSQDCSDDYLEIR